MQKTRIHDSWTRERAGYVRACKDLSNSTSLVPIAAGKVSAGQLIKLQAKVRGKDHILQLLRQGQQVSSGKTLNGHQSRTCSAIRSIWVPLERFRRDPSNGVVF
ncbi:hypothetical protein MAR_033236 [Mya arenaria]|uniref:Uncharacterized protein n=1 Tax=Mya arenaria TaxID=6604 RepID=A0ABY7GB44_MYAAR|nr:hypothetical protein MAR_033236 [Mya arenaria]